jgi:hypothetical protein
MICLFAIAAEAASGALMGTRRQMDLFGVSVVDTIRWAGSHTPSICYLPSARRSQPRCWHGGFAT